MPYCDYVLPLMSIPSILGHGLQEIAELSNQTPYLFPNHVATLRLRRELDKIPGMKVGLAWQGNPKHLSDCDRSIPIRYFEKIMGLENVTIVSLQRGPGERDIDAFKGRYNIIDWPHAKQGLEATGWRRVLH
jgi:hypothetical protein